MTDTDTRPGAPDAAAGERDPQVQAMARTFDRTQRKVDTLATHVSHLAADVTRLAGVLTAGCPPDPGAHPDSDPPTVGPDGGPGAVPAMRSWLLAADPDQAVTDLGDLVEWLDRVYLQFPGVELSACWLWHPHVIEELWWLHNAHADAYHPHDGSWLRVGDWHDRQRPAVTKRVRDAVGKCDLSLHAPDRPHGQPPAAVPLAAHVAVIADAWTTGGTRPEPTAEQLAEGVAYFQALYRSQR